MEPTEPNNPKRTVEDALRDLRSNIPAADIAIQEYKDKKDEEARAIGTTPSPVLRPRPHPRALKKKMLGHAPTEVDTEELVPDLINGGLIMKKFTTGSSNDESGQ